jgi:CTP:molybdopterin cytidylyltransferase MocA
MVAAVVLAAGASTRMGSAKLLLPLGGEPLVRRAVRQVLGAGFDEVLVVVGYQFQPIIAVLAGLPCRPVVNHEYQTGMGSSFRAAIAALGQTEAAMFTLADQPFVTEHEYRALLDAYHRTERVLRRALATGTRCAAGAPSARGPVDDAQIRAGVAARCGYARGLRARDRTAFRELLTVFSCKLRHQRS